mgnify:CR=1 FL=1
MDQALVNSRPQSLIRPLAIFHAAGVTPERELVHVPMQVLLAYMVEAADDTSLERREV